MTEQSTGGPTSATPFWFGPRDRPLLGWLHLPAEGMARGGVVLCQPLGIEAICVYFSYRTLADRLAQMGLAVLRFDYDGTGDSVGAETDPERLDSWLASLTLATDLLAGTGVGTVGLVGIRMGALLAATEAVRRGGVDGLVLWDPCLSGRAFLREQRFLRLLATEGDGREDTAVEAPGIRFEAETVKELGDLDMTRTEGALAARTLVLAPPGRSHPRRLEARLAGAPVEWQEATGQEDLLDSQLQETPFDTIERVALWLSAVLDATPVRVSPPDSGSAAVARGADGRVVSERPVALGALPLFGMVTEPAGRVDGPTIVLVDEGNTHHIGQSRVWVDLARRLGGEGFRVLRFDLSGNGDSGTRPGQMAHVARAPEAGDDVWQAQTAIAPDDPSDVVLIGFCSGAYQIAEGSLTHPTRGICIINPSFSFVPPEESGSWRRLARQSSRRWFVTLATRPAAWASGRRGAEESRRWINALDIGTWPVAVAMRHGSIPKPVWWLVHRLLLEQTGVATLERIVDADVDTLLVCGPDDLLPISLGSEGRVARMEQSDHFRIVILEDLDHSSWPLYQRRRMIDVLAEHLVSRYRPAPTERTPGDERPMKAVELDPHSSLAPYEQIRAQIAAAIDSGALAPAARLPTVRSLAAQVGVAVNTVARSYRQLEQEGLVTTHGRHGTFVATDTPVARHQAVVEARAFAVRMHELGIGPADMFAILRSQTLGQQGHADHTGAGLPSPDDPRLDPPSA